MLTWEAKVTLLILVLTVMGVLSRLFCDDPFYGNMFSGIAIGVYIGEYMLWPRIRRMISKPTE